MTNTYKAEVDLHVHSLASGHAYSTINEIAAEAASRGLRGIAMTDHGPAMPAASHSYHFECLYMIPDYLSGVRILKGAETNIIAPGRVDLSDRLLAKMDLVLAGFHHDCGYGPSDRKANTSAVMELMENPNIHIICHPGNPGYPLDYEAVARQAAATGTALELNNSSFVTSRIGSADNCRLIARLCARFGGPVSLGSDAHIAQSVGHFGHVFEALSAAGVDPDQIINRSLEATLDFLGLTD
jgi:putative hydrolase